MHSLGISIGLLVALSHGSTAPARTRNLPPDLATTLLFAGVVGGTSPGKVPNGTVHSNNLGGWGGCFGSGNIGGVT